MMMLLSWPPILRTRQFVLPIRRCSNSADPNREKAFRFMWYGKPKKKAPFAISMRPEMTPISYLALIFPVGCCGLSVWQYFEYQRKAEIIDDLKQRISEPLNGLPADQSKFPPEFSAVKVRGHFDHSRELVMEPRPRVVNWTELKKKEWVGGNIITPFILADRSLTILVNRGWVPEDRYKAESRPLGQVAGELDLTGFIRYSHFWNYLSMEEEDPAYQRWSFRDVQGIAKFLGTAPIWLDANAESTVVGGPIGGQTELNFENKSHFYTMWWFGLMVLSSFMWYATLT